MRIVVVGGGTAGAFATALIKSKRPDYDVVNVRSPEIPIIGVGESTTPIIVRVLNDCGILKEFISRKDVVWPKYGVKFVDWHDKPHYNGWAINGFRQETMVFLYGLTKGEDKFLGRLDDRIDQGLIPYNKNGDKFYSVVGAHIDASDTSEFVFEKFKDKVTNILGTVTDVHVSEKGIEGIQVGDQRISGDVYIDCTGFRRRLISALSYEVSGKSRLVKSELPPNAAAYLPITEKKQSHDFWTTATAGEAGWMWNIPFKNRNGAGYVYNDDNYTKDQAAKELADIYGVDPDIVGHFKFEGGWLEQPAVKNVFSMGLAAGFLDALDASSLHITFRQIYNFLDFEDNPNEYNRAVRRDYRRIHEYISLYYQTCNYKSPFWDSIKKLTNRQMEDKFIAMYDTDRWDDYDLSGFTNSVIARIIANRIDIPHERLLKCLNRIKFSDMKHAINEFNIVKDMYVPWDKNIWMKNMLDTNEFVKVDQRELEWDNR